MLKVEKKNIILEEGPSFYKLYLKLEKDRDILLTRMDLLDLKEAIEEILK